METDTSERRKSLRLQGYDYTLAGAYFITAVTFNRQDIFCDVIDAQVKINPFGEIVNQTWLDLPRHFPFVRLDEYVIMPNHFHGIIVLEDTSNCGALKSKSLSEVVRAFKTFSAKKINKLRGSHGIQVWQRSFYDRIIRNEHEYQMIVDYIQVNPQNWLDDKTPISNLEYSE